MRPGPLAVLAADVLQLDEVAPEGDDVEVAAAEAARALALGAAEGDRARAQRRQVGEHAARATLLHAPDLAAEVGGRVEPIVRITGEAVEGDGGVGRGRGVPGLNVRWIGD